MKKYSFFCVIMLSVFVLFGCDPSSDNNGKLKVGFVYVSPVGDAGWTYAHDQGRKELEKLDFVASTSVVESVKENADAKRIITQFAEKGFKLIFTTSYGYMDPTFEVAQNYPKHVFMHCSGFKTSKNMGTYFGRMYQARYLTGLVAGKKTKVNKIGYVAAYPIPEVVRGINAFALGVRQANKNAKVYVVWTHTWYDPSKERSAAEGLLKTQGVDIIAQHQDSPGPQQAAQEHGKFAIGYNADMKKFAPKAHLVAAVWNWGVVYKYIAKQVHKKKWKSQEIWWGIKEGLVDISPLNKDLVSKEIIDLVQKKRSEIIKGKLEVFRGPIKDQDGKIRIKANKVPSDKELLSMLYFVEGVVGEIPKKK